MKEQILGIVRDLATGFVYYDRKEDEDLSMDQLNEAVESGGMTVDDMVAEFRKQLEATYPYN